MSVTGSSRAVSVDALGLVSDVLEERLRGGVARRRRAASRYP
ncbi:hypothetical protein [Natronorubrum texcoconense]|nr:hypothetical protein [Natronorubrum texcoconense]